MIGFSHSCATDMPFTGMLTISLVCAAAILGLVPPNQDAPVLPRVPWLVLILFGFFEGLAVLAKGPAALILTGGAVFFWALCTKRWRDAFRLLQPAAIAAFCLTALPWYILCARRNPDFFRVFIIEHNFKRFLTAEFQHHQPIWFYLPILVLAFVPWTGLTIWGIVAASMHYRKTRSLSPLSSLFLIFALFCVLFFSISRSKLPGYVLPSLPPLALLLSRGVQTLVGTFRRSAKLALLCTGAMLVLASVTLLFQAVIPVHHSAARELLTGAIAILAFVLSMPSFLLTIAMRKAEVDPSKSVFGRIFVIPILLVVLFAGKLVPLVMPVDASGRTITEELNEHHLPIHALRVQNVNRGTHYSLNFYTRTEVPDWDALKPTTGFLLLSSRFCDIWAGKRAACEEPPIFLVNSKRFVYRVAPRDSLGGAAGGRQPQ